MFDHQSQKGHQKGGSTWNQNIGESGNKLFPFTVCKMPDQRPEEVDETLENADNHQAHQDPLRNFSEQRPFDDLSEAQSDGGHYHRRHNCHPNGDSFHKLYFIHYKRDYVCQLLFSLVLRTSGYSVLLPQQ